MRTLRYKLPLLDEDIDMNISKSFVSVSAIALSALGLAATFGAPHAFAADDKNLPARMCVQFAGGGTPSPEYGSIGNTGNDWVFLECPAVKDNIGGRILSGWVLATDRHPDLNVTCNLLSLARRKSDSAVFYHSSVNISTSGSGNHVQQLSFGQSLRGYDHYIYGCSIPPARPDNGAVSQIHTYQVNEE